MLVYWRIRLQGLGSRGRDWGPFLREGMKLKLMHVGEVSIVHCAKYLHGSFPK